MLRLRRERPRGAVSLGAALGLLLCAAPAPGDAGTPAPRPELALLVQGLAADEGAFAAWFDGLAPAERVAFARQAALQARAPAAVAKALRALPRAAAATDPALRAAAARGSVERALAARALPRAAWSVERLRTGLEPEARRALLQEARPWSSAPPSGTLDPRLNDLLDGLADAVLGIRFEQTEASLPSVAEMERRYGRNETYRWTHLDASTLQTPYVDLARIRAALSPKPGERLVDLGSGYGRVAFFFAVEVPGLDVWGYEIVQERTAEANRVKDALGLTGVHLLEQDLTAPGFEPIEADYYVMYDPFAYEVIQTVLDDLRAIAARKRFRLVAIEGRGGLHQALARQGWLRKVQGLQTVRSSFLPPILIFDTIPAVDGGR